MGILVAQQDSHKLNNLRLLFTIMKFDLTRNQIQILIANDPSFLDKVLDTLEGPNPVDTKAKQLVKTFGPNRVGAIKELREWSRIPENFHDVQRNGYDTYTGENGYSLSLLAAKRLIEKHHPLYLGNGI